MKRILFLVLILSGIHANLYSQTIIKDAEEWYLFTGDKLNLYIYEFGKGDTVLVLHGGFGAEHSYLLDALVPLQNRYHFICFDQRGSLRSPSPDSLLTMPKMIFDIDQIRKEFRLSKIRILAHSMGTLLAMEYARRYPANVRSLTLTGSFPPKVDSLFTFSRNLYKEGIASHYLSSRKELTEVLTRENLNNRDFKELSAKEKSRYWRINYAAVNIYHVARYKQKKGGVAFYNQKTGDVILNSGTVPFSWDFTSCLRQSSIPLTVVNGDHDYIDFTALTQSDLVDKSAVWLNEMGIEKSQIRKSYTWGEFTKQIPQLNLYIIKNAGHNSWIDEPGLFKKYMIKALSR